MGMHFEKIPKPAVCCSVLQCVAVCCSVLQRVAACCSVFQCVLQRVAMCVAECCSVLQYVAVCCSVSYLVCVLQCVAMCVAVCVAVSPISYRLIEHFCDDISQKSAIVRFYCKVATHCNTMPIFSVLQCGAVTVKSLDIPIWIVKPLYLLKYAKIPTQQFLEMKNNLEGFLL